MRKNIFTRQIILFCLHGKRYPAYRVKILILGKTFRLIWSKVTFYSIFLRRRYISLVSLPKCFLANRDNFFSYEQALRKFPIPHSCNMPCSPMTILQHPRSISVQNLDRISFSFFLAANNSNSTAE